MCFQFSSKGGKVVKNPPANAGDAGLLLGLGRSPGEAMATTTVFLPEKCHGQRGLAGYRIHGVTKSGT